ncbi:MAG: type II toxin-antitoxin system VapC family toxin [Terrimicrobiaceae bacterium]
MRHYTRDQKATHQWWANDRVRFGLYTSIFTIDEAAGGDAGAATRRASFLQGIPQLTVTPEIEPLANDLAQLLKLPAKAVMDASHLAICILHQMDYLLTWNCTHLANPVLQKELVEYCRYHDLYIPIICTPEALLLASP